MNIVGTGAEEEVRLTLEHADVLVSGLMSERSQGV